jgi:mRNA interferase HicA
MKRRELERHLRDHGCEFHHSGGKHDVWWNPNTGAMASMPRHRTVKKPTARGICRDLGVPLTPGL